MSTFGIDFDDTFTADPAHCPATMFDGHKQVGCLLAFGHTGDHLTDEGAWWTARAAPVAGETAQQQRMTAAGASLRLNELLREPEALRAALAGSPNNERARLLGVLEAPGFVLMAAADALEFKGDRLRDEGRVDEAEAAFRAQDALLAWRRGADLCCGLCDGPFPCADTEHGNRYPYTAPAVETARRAAAAPPAPEPPAQGDPQPVQRAPEGGEPLPILCPWCGHRDPTRNCSCFVAAPSSVQDAEDEALMRKFEHALIAASTGHASDAFALRNTILARLRAARGAGQAPAEPEGFAPIDDQGITAMPERCTRHECRSLAGGGSPPPPPYPARLFRNERGFMECPRCHASYGA